MVDRKKRTIKNGKYVDVDDWPKELDVGDKVTYQFKRWTIIEKYSDEWHGDKPTFALKRKTIFGRLIIIEV